MSYERSNGIYNVHCYFSLLQIRTLQQKMMSLCTSLRYSHRETVHQSSMCFQSDAEELTT